MHKLMTKWFARWANKQDLPDGELADALDEVANGNSDADLGGHLFKKRVQFTGKGKSGSGRVLICFEKDHMAIFVYAFAKNKKGNISKKELVGLKVTAATLLKLSTDEIEKAVDAGEFVEL